jgi:hypothetical protein
MITTSAFQAAARAATGVEGMFNEDLHAWLNLIGAPQGHLPGRLYAGLALLGISTSEYQNALELLAANGPVFGGDFTVELPAPFTFTRSSSAMRVNQNKELELVASGLPRFDYDLLTGLPQGLLLEGQATNLVPTSGEIASVMSIGAGSKTQAATTILGRPATTFTADLSNASHYVSGGSLASAPPASTVHTASAYVRMGNVGFAQLTVSVSHGSTTDYVNFDLTTGAISNGATVLSSSAADCGNGVWRLTMTFTTNAAPASGGASVIVSPMDSMAYARLPVYQNLPYSVDVTGMQLELGSCATSYIPTFGSAATRAAETLTASTASWLNASLGTLVVEFDRPTIPAAALGYNPIVAILRNTSTTRLAVLCGSGTPAQQRFDVSDTTTQAALTFANGTAGTDYKVAAAWSTDYFHAAQNATLATPDTLGTVPAGITTLELGNFSTSFPSNGHIRRFAYYASVLADAQLQALTA